MFQAIENDVAKKRTEDQNLMMEKIREDVKTQLWNITLQLNSNQSSYLKE